MRRRHAAVNTSLALTAVASCLVLVGVFLAWSPRDEVSAQPGLRWKLLAEETFEHVSLPVVEWLPDDHPVHQRDDGRFGDRGEFFRKRGVVAPEAYRLAGPFGTDGWLTVESYSQSKGTPPGSLFARTPDPAPDRSGNHVLRISSLVHTDGTVIRSTSALPPEYRVCVKVGYASFGDGIKGPGRLNGYVGNETDPWGMWRPIKDNGFYWLAILDDLPRPRNNVWIHHHRKLTIDSDNNVDAWSDIWNGARFVRSGVRPVFVLGVDREGPDYDNTGKPYISFAGGRFQPQEKVRVRAVDAYKERTWYTACAARVGDQYWLSVTGEFQYGGSTTYLGAIPIARVYHAEIGSGGWPEYFMFGDPHTNYYRGEVYYDDVRLEVPAG
jgi:hypothetical protein